jgi:hypothetical protein
VSPSLNPAWYRGHQPACPDRKSCLRTGESVLVMQHMRGAYAFNLAPVLTSRSEAHLMPACASSCLASIHIHAFPKCDGHVYKGMASNTCDPRTSCLIDRLAPAR